MCRSFRTLLAGESHSSGQVCERSCPLQGEGQVLPAQSKSGHVHIIVCIGACASTSTVPADSQPAVVIRRLPRPNVGGPIESLDCVVGRVEVEVVGTGSRSEKVYSRASASESASTPSHSTLHELLLLEAASASSGWTFVSTLAAPCVLDLVELIPAMHHTPAVVEVEVAKWWRC